MFKFITDTAQAAVDITCDTAGLLVGESDGPKREDVAQMFAAGMTVTAIAVALDMTSEAVEALIEKEHTDE